MLPLDKIADVGALRSEDSKLTIGVITFELTQSMSTVYQRHRQTDDLRQQYRALHYVYRAVIKLIQN